MSSGNLRWWPKSLLCWNDSTQKWDCDWLKGSIWRFVCMCVCWPPFSQSCYATVLTTQAWKFHRKPPKRIRLEVLHITRYINLLTYLLTYLLEGKEGAHLDVLSRGLRVTIVKLRHCEGRHDDILCRSYDNPHETQWNICVRLNDRRSIQYYVGLTGKRSN